jgi:hypothetical protein
MEEFTHYILTKYNTMSDPNGSMLYDKRDPDGWMDYRGMIFEETKKSVLSQEGDFQWIISIDERTPKKYLDQIQTDSRITLVFKDIRAIFLDGDVVPDTPWTITTRLDNDDRYLQGAVKAIQRQFEPHLKVIDFDFQKMDYRSGKLFPSIWKWENSPFISLVEPSNRVLTAFCRPHGQVAGEYPSGELTGTYPAGADRTRIASTKLKGIYAYQVIHERNITNSI